MPQILDVISWASKNFLPLTMPSKYLDPSTEEKLAYTNLSPAYSELQAGVVFDFSYVV